MKIFIAGLLLLFTNLNNTIADTWKPVSATISFTIKHALGATAEGSFKGFEGSLVFNPNDLRNASLKGSIETKTINTGLGLRDNTLRGNTYFEVDKYPKITMVSTKIEKSTHENEYIGYFNLTIKSTTKSVRIPFTFAQNGTQATFKGDFTINRLDYGIGSKSALLAETARINIIIQSQLI